MIKLTNLLNEDKKSLNESKLNTSIKISKELRDLFEIEIDMKDGNYGMSRWNRGQVPMLIFHRDEIIGRLWESGMNLKVEFFNRKYKDIMTFQHIEDILPFAKTNDIK